MKNANDKNEVNTRRRRIYQKVNKRCLDRVGGWVNGCE